MSKFKKTPAMEFTKVVWKLKINPLNCPASKQLNQHYEISLEFKCPSSEVCQIDGDEILSDNDETLTNLTLDTNFMIKSKTISCNYEELKNQLGYEPDAIEFDCYLKNLLKKYQSQFLTLIKVSQ